MRYHDTGTQDAGQALATWLDSVLKSGITELRLQSGYFGFDAVRAISGFLKSAREENLTTNFVLGSNDGDTLHSDVSKLTLKLGLPRSGARLAVVNFGNALFHPKVYHATRSDGSQTAFVGSANFTAPGLTGANVEAAFSVCTLEGDSEELLNKVRAAIDRWFGLKAEDGVHVIESQADVDELLVLGLLAQTRPPRTSKVGGGGVPNTSAKRQKLVKLPPWLDGEEGAGEESELEVAEALDDEAVAPNFAGETTATGATAMSPLAIDEPQDEVEQPEEPDLIPVEQRNGFPTYILFEPGATSPTSGWAAMSGWQLEPPFVGLILRLTKDSARHFKGGDGTANISIPVAVAKTFRFGVLQSSGRPRAEFGLRVRYYSDTLIVEEQAQTNVMAYGYMSGETGHGDLRMLLPTAVKRISAELKKEEQPAPDIGDLFLLEWPNAASDSFSLTFLNPEADIAQQARDLYTVAEADGKLIGGACWLPPSLAPDW